MNRKTKLAAFMVALAVLAPAIGGVALASQTVAFGGDAAGTDDQTDNTRIQVGSTLNNTTVQMAESQTISPGGSLAFTVNVTPESAEIDSFQGTDPSATLGTNIVDDTLYVNETANGSGSATLESLNVTFDVSDNVSTNGSVPDAINVSAGNAMESKSQLIADDDDSEVHNYTVYGVDNGDVLDWDISVDNGEVNTTSGEYVPNETGQAVFTIDVTRNNTTYENMTLEDHKVHVSFDKSGFSSISEETNETAGKLVLAQNGIGDFTDDGDEDKGYKFGMVQQNNTTRDYTLKFNVTVENADDATALQVNSIHDPEGGVQASGGADYGLHNAGSTSNFLNIPLDLSNPLTLLFGGVAIVAVIGGVVYASDQQSGFAGYGAFAPGGYGMLMNILWAAMIIAGLSMIIGPITAFWDGIVVDGLGAPSWATMVAGFVLAVAGAGLAVRKHLDRM